jgi:hypothetical protein
MAAEGALIPAAPVTGWVAYLQVEGTVSGFSTFIHVVHIVHSIPPIK